ncbi:hypothetical protein [Streptomyces sp. NPDC060243]|uniref:hypothetical protein n=1 Tax=Streptomyces sp. NPDC060243 TaxID=3347081 RepID=UPI003663C2A4
MTRAADSWGDHMSGHFFSEPVPVSEPDPFAPRFVEPGEHPGWDTALAVVNRDVRATLPDEPPLRLLACPGDPDEPERLYVARANGEWHGNGLPAEAAGSLPDACDAVAAATQDTLMELLHRAWPVCPDHRLGTHLRAAPGAGSAWWCAGRTASDPSPHVLAPVGGLADEGGRAAGARAQKRAPGTPRTRSFGSPA